MMKSICICFSPKSGRSDTSSFPEVMVALYLNISYTNICRIMCIFNVCMKSFILLDIISLSYCFFVSSVGEYHWLCLHTINIYILHGKPIIVPVLYNVLYVLSLCYEQSPHRQLYIETSIGCSCV